MNNALMFATGNDVMSTPQKFYDQLDAEFAFVCDVAATLDNAKSLAYFGPDHADPTLRDALVIPWPTHGANFCNPPYSRPHQANFVKKAAAERLRGVTTVMLLPSRTDTAVFHDLIWQQPGVEVRFLRGRLKFGGEVNAAPFPSMVVIFRGESVR